MTTTTTAKSNQGGMKHNLSKTKKLKVYRRLLRTLKNKAFKTKSAKVHKQQKIQYLKSRIHKLSHNKRSRKLRRQSKPVKPVIAAVVADNYVSPRIVPISSSASPSVISPSAPVVENIPSVPSAVPISSSLPSSLPSSISPSSSQENITVNLSPLTSSIPVSIAQTDSSMPSVGSVAPPPVVPPPPVLNATPTQMATSPSPLGDSLHLSDLAVSNPPSPTSMDTKTTVESQSV